MHTFALRRVKKIVEKSTSLALVALLSVLTYLALPVSVKAAELNGESTSLSDPTISKTGVVYTLTIGNVSNSLIKCINIGFTGPAATLPTGMDITPSSITPSGTIGAIGSWTESNPETYAYQLTDSTGITPTAGSKTIVLTGVGNGSVKNTTYYTTVNTYSDDTCTTPVDSNGVATFVFTEGVLVSGTVNPTLTFTVDSTTCGFGVLSATAAKTCTHTMTAASNATSGYAISYIASTTLTSGTNTITDTGSTGATSSTGTEQFGLNLMANTTPLVGADPSGGNGAAATNYATANTFSFNSSGATVATTTIPSALTTYTVSYLANISAVTEAGLYTKTQTYNITANY